MQRSVVLPLGSLEETLTVVGGGPRDPWRPHRGRSGRFRRRADRRR